MILVDNLCNINLICTYALTVVNVRCSNFVIFFVGISRAVETRYNRHFSFYLIREKVELWKQGSLLKDHLNDSGGGGGGGEIRADLRFGVILRKWTQSMVF